MNERQAQRSTEHAIIDAGTRGRSSACSRATAGRPRLRAPRRGDRRPRARGRRPRAAARSRRKFDGVDRPLEVTRDEMRAGAATRAGRRAARDPPGGAATSRASRPGRSRSTWTSRSRPGVVVEQRVEPLARVGCYVPGGRFPLPSSLLMTAIPARVAGVREVIAVCPRPEPAVMAAALEAGVTRLLPRRRRARDRRARLRHRARSRASTRSSARATATSPRPRRCVSADCAIDFYAGPTEIVIVAGGGRAEWIAADLIAQAEHDPDARSIFITWSRPLAERVVAQAWRGSRAGRDIVAAVAGAHTASSSSPRSPEEAMALANRIAPEHLVVDREALIQRPVVAGAVFVGPFTAQAAGDYATGSNHVLPTAGAARFRGGLSAADFVRVMAVQRLTRDGLDGAGADDRAAGPRRGAARARRVDRGAAVMNEYEKPAELYDGLRLHQNENTGGCSPRVLEALGRPAARADRRLSAVPGGHRRAARSYLGVDPDRPARSSTASTKGILAAAIGYLRPTAGRRRARGGHSGAGLRDLRASTREVVGGRVGPRRRRTPDFSFPLDEVLAAITPRTRVVFLTNPNNPTGVSTCRSRRSAPWRGSAAPARSCSSTRPTRLRAAQTFIPELAALPQRRRRPDVLEGVRAGRPPHRRGHRRTRRRSSRCGWPCRSTASTSPPSSRVRRRLSDRAYVERLPAAGRSSRRRCSTPPAIAWGCPTGRARPTSCWSNGRRHAPALVERRRGARHLPARPLEASRGARAASASRPGIVEHTRGCLAVLEEVLCAAR